MPRTKPRDSNGLTDTERKYCVARAQGKNMRESYSLAIGKPARKSHGESGSKMNKRPHVMAYVTKLLDGSHIADMDNVGVAWRELVEAIERAKEDGNHNAIASLLRIRLQGLGALQNNVNMTVNGQLTDKALVERLAGTKDKAKVALLTEALGEDTFDNEVLH